LKKILTSPDKFTCPIYSAYIIISSSFYGWNIVAFIINYSNLDEYAIINRLSTWMTWQHWVLFILFLISIAVFLVRHNILKVLRINYKFFFYHWYIQVLIVLIGSLNVGLYQTENYVHLFRLIEFSLCIWASVLLASQFYDSDILILRHPTTIGSSIISTLILGISVIILSDIFEDVVNSVIFWYLTLIIFDMFIFVARFRYLSAASNQTKLFAQRLMGSLILFTGIRLIIGIFMPLVYSVYMIISAQNFGHGIALMMMIGQIIDRPLFLCYNTANSLS